MMMDPIPIPSLIYKDFKNSPTSQLVDQGGGTSLPTDHGGESQRGEIKHLKGKITTLVRSALTSLTRVVRQAPPPTAPSPTIHGGKISPHSPRRPQW